MRLAILGTLLALGFTGTAAAAQCTPAEFTPDIANDLPPAPVSQWWQRDVRTAPVHPDSDAYVRFLGPSRKLQADFGGRADSRGAIRGFPVAEVRPYTVLRPVVFDDWRRSAAVDAATGEGVAFYPIPEQARELRRFIEGGAPGRVDERKANARRMLMLDCATRHYYELAGVWYDEAMGEWRARHGMFWPLDMRAGAGIPILPLLAQYEESADRSRADLGHALRLTVRASDGHVFPAAESTGRTRGALPLGSRLRLKASVDGRDPANRTRDPLAQRLFRTMQRYGVVVAEEGPDFAISGSHDPRWSKAALDPAFALLQASDFEVLAVDEPVGPAASPPSLSVSDARTFEGNPGGKTYQLNFVVRLSTVSSTPVTFDLATVANNATADVDYVSRTQLGATIPPGQLTYTFSVDVIPDLIVDEPKEIMKVNLTNPVGATINDGQGRGEIINDEGPAKLSVANGTYPEFYGTRDPVDPEIYVAVTLAFPYKNTVRTWVRPDPVTASTADFGGEPRRLTWNIGTCCTQFYRAYIIDDDLPEPDEVFDIVLYDPINAILKNEGGLITIQDDDGPIALTVAENRLSTRAPEGDSGTSLMSFPISLSQPSDEAVTLTLTTRAPDYTPDGGAATAGVDYEAKSETIVIPAGETTASFEVTIHGDTFGEANEYFDVVVSDVSGASYATTFPPFGTILNDDTANLRVADAQKLEGTGGTAAMAFTVSLSEPVGVPVDFSFRAYETGSATEDDFVPIQVSRTIPAGQTSHTVSVPLVTDAEVEANETFGVRLICCDGDVTEWDGEAIGTILNDDGPHLSVSDAMLTEGNAGTKSATFTVSLGNASAEPVGFTLATANGSATGGSDFVALAPVEDSIAAGMLSKTRTITVNGDTVAEANETFALNLSNAQGATVADAQGIGSIRNDDGPTLSIANATIVEGDAGTQYLVFMVSLSQAASVPVSYTIATGNGSATAGSDYVAKTVVGQVLAPGVTKKTFSVVINGDTVAEGNETFMVDLSNATGASIYDGRGMGTITNDD